MSNRLRVFALIISALGITLMLLSLEAYIYYDGINMKLAPVVADALGVMSGTTESEASFRPSNKFELSEAAAIYIIGGVGAFLGFISIVLGFGSIKRCEHPAVSYGAIAFGIAPVILISIPIAIGCFLLLAPIVIWYKKTVNKALK